MTGTTVGIEGLHNFRDTGGTPLADGGTTRSGVLFRSDALATLTPAGQEELAATDIGVIVDLRMPAERQVAPDRVPSSRPFRVVELSIIEGAMADMARQLLKAGGSLAPDEVAQVSASLPTLDELYLEMLQHGGAAFVELARLVATSADDAARAVLVHCTAGKDRTGVATALMLDAVGAERPAVIADYAASQNNLAGTWADAMIQTVSSFGLPMTPELRTLLTATPPAAIERALAWVDAEHGGAAGYLRSAGLEPDELAALRSRLTG